MITPFRLGFESTNSIFSLPVISNWLSLWVTEGLSFFYIQSNQSGQNVKCIDLVQFTKYIKTKKFLSFIYYGYLKCSLYLRTKKKSTVKANVFDNFYIQSLFQFLLTKSRTDRSRREEFLNELRVDRVCREDNIRVSHSAHIHANIRPHRNP